MAAGINNVMYVDEYISKASAGAIAWLVLSGSTCPRVSLRAEMQQTVRRPYHIQTNAQAHTPVLVRRGSKRVIPMSTLYCFSTTVVKKNKEPKLG